MPSVEMVMSRLPMASRQRLPSSPKSWPWVLCQKNGSKLSKPRSAISVIFCAALPSVALIMVPTRIDFMEFDKMRFLDFYFNALLRAATFDRGQHHAEAFDIIGASGFWGLAGFNRLEKSRDNTGMTMSLGGMWRGRNHHIPERPMKTAVVCYDVSIKFISAIQQQCSIGSDDTPCGFPTGLRTFSNPRAAISENNIVRKFEDRIGGSAVGIP